MQQQKVIELLNKIGQVKINIGAKGIMTNCPLTHKHSKGTDQHPSLFIFTGDDFSNCFCHSCGFKGGLKTLVEQIENISDEQRRDMSIFIQNFEHYSAALKGIKFVEDFENISNGVKYNLGLKKLSKVSTPKKPVKNIKHTLFLVPPDGGEKICAMKDNVNVSQIATCDIERMVLPFLNEVPKYWQDRGFSIQTAKDWGVGHQKNFLYYKIKDKQKFYMDFGDRLLISIRDQKKNLVGWSARTLDSNEMFIDYKHPVTNEVVYKIIGNPKYLHCPAFKRNDYLYGEHLIDAKNSACILVEGFFDAINLSRYGYTNALAVMGTHLSSTQIKKLKYWFNKVFIFMDGDDAGESASLAIERTLKEEKLKPIRIDNRKFWGKDPGDMSSEEICDIFVDVF